MQEVADVPTGDSKLRALRRCLEICDFDQLDTLWMELIEGDDLSADRLGALLEAAEELLSMGMRERAAPLLELLHPVASTSGNLPAPSLLRLVELLVRAIPQSPAYRAEYVERFQELHGPASAERAFFAVCGIADAADPAGAFDRFRRLMRFQPGAVVFHPSGWGIGEVRAVDPFLGQVKVDLEHKPDHRIAMEAVDSILDVLPDDSFRALLYRGGDVLREMAEVDPAGLVARVLEDFGSPLPQKEIKARLVPDVVEPAAWTRWWGQAKKLLRASGFYRVGDRAPYLVEKLEKALSFEDDLLARFASGDWREVRLVARQVLRAGPGAFPSAYPQVRSALEDRLGEERDPARALEIAWTLHRGKDGAGDGEPLRAALRRFPAAATAEGLAVLPSTEELERLMDAVREARPEDWTEIARAAFTGKNDALRAAACRVLEREAPEVVQSLAAEICASPRHSPETYCWLLERKLAGESRPSLGPLAQRTARGLLVLAADLVEHLVDKQIREGRAAVKDLFKRIEGLLYHGRGQFFREAVTLMEFRERLEIHRGLVRNQRQIPQVAARLIEILVEIDPMVARQDEVPDWRNDKVIFSTARGLERREAELRELKDVKLPAIFKAIGDAAAFGDLSENAEFTSALEERDSLVKRAERIQAELEKVRLIERSAPRKGEVSVGSKIRVLNLDSGDEKVFSVLGPWDGGPEEGVLNYRSPLGQVFLGKRGGDEVVVELPGGTGRYKILECGSYSE